MTVAAAADPVAPATLPRLLDGLSREGRPVQLDAHLRRVGALPASRDLIAAVDRAGLHGRGGAGFPTARKLQAVADARGRAVVVANGTEGEPMSAKDALLLACAPHLVLDGVVAAALAVGAKEAVVAVNVAARPQLAIVSQALDERRGRRVDRGVELRLASVPDRFVAGEETALVRWLNGGPPKPTFVPPRPFERGVDGRPTLVQNVETLADIALIARNGPEWFAELGDGEERGSALVTLAGAVRRRGVYEIALGTRLDALLARAGGPVQPPRAILLGGYFGSWVDARETEMLRLADAALRQRGLSLGARTIVVLPEGACPVAEVARVARYLAGESSGQCGPCVHGLAAVADALERIQRGRAAGVREQALAWLTQIDGRGACGHPDGAVRFVDSALRVFADEFEQHARRGRCGGADGHLLRTGGRQ